MAKGFTSGGVDFDDLFDPDVMGDGPTASFLTSGGVALKYAALSYGTKRADVGFRNAAGVDVTNLWAAKGTAVYAGPIAPGFAESYTNSRADDHDIAADVKLTIKADGTWTVTKTTAGTIVGTPLLGTWHNAPAAGVGAGCQMRWTDAGPWISLSADKSETVSAFATTGEGGPANDIDTKAFQISFRNNDGSMEVRALTSITAEASV